jgi:hypothetical protein
VSAMNGPAQQLCNVLGLHMEGGVVRDLYRTLAGPARDAYLVVGRLH